MRVETGLLAPEGEQYAGQGQPRLELAAFARNAADLEELGFDNLCMPEAGHDPFLPLAIAAEHTQRVQLATNVAIAFPRSPMVTAQLAWDLQNLSRGRFSLGLGTQVKGHNEGEHYRFTLLPPFFNPGPSEWPQVPLYTAAVNPYMARLAGELCDGLRLHPVATFRYTREVLAPAIAEGAARSGRDLAGFDLIGEPFTALGRNEAEVAQAREDVRKQIAFYASTRSYHPVLAHHGWEDVGLELHRLSIAGEWAKMPALITDAMLDEWVLTGTYDKIGDIITSRAGGLYSSIVLLFPADVRKDTDLMREIVNRVHAARAMNRSNL